MRPMLPFYDVVDGGRVNHELVGEALHGYDSRLVAIPYFQHLRFCKFVAVVALAALVSFLSSHVFVVIVRRAQEKMIRVHATRVVAPVKDAHAFGNVSFVNRPTEAVGITIGGGPAVAQCVFVAFPVPTPFGFDRVFPKSNFCAFGNVLPENPLWLRLIVHKSSVLICATPSAASTVRGHFHYVPSLI